MLHTHYFMSFRLKKKRNNFIFFDHHVLNQNLTLLLWDFSHQSYVKTIKNWILPKIKQILTKALRFQPATFEKQTLVALVNIFYFKIK